jgi:ATP-dependent DNA helicase PIF1
MSDKFISSNTIRKRKSRENETSDHHENRVAKQREKTREKRAVETAGERNTRRTYDRERKRLKLANETDEQRKKRLEYRKKLRNYVSNIEEPQPQPQCGQATKKMPQQVQVTNKMPQQVQVHQVQVQQDRTMEMQQNRSDESSAGDHHKSGRVLLKRFRDKVDKFKYSLCPVCNESFPSIVIVSGECCRRCYTEKDSPKKFSAENNMDPGEVPEELQGLSEIEEMLIARVFPVMSVYRLRGGQHGYHGNVINFPQDVKEFATHLPQHPSSLDVLIVRRQSANDSATFRDFKVRRDKITRALWWLKENNCYYSDIVIDNEIIQSLPIDGPIDDRFQHTQITVEDEDEDEDNVITRTFVPLPPPTRREDVSIRNTLDRVENGERPIEWPQINNYPINEFQTPGYIACAFPTLYPTGYADLRAIRIRDVKPAEYFKHLLQYKDGRFARHSRWKYFALNSQMRWRALQEGKVYVKQNLNDDQITVTDIQERIAQGDNHIADRIMRFGEGLRGSRQFWNARRWELSDMITQIGSQGLVFFTFSAADLHWPELHKLMPSSGNSAEETGSIRNNHQNIIDNPHLVDWFFQKRFEIFLKDVLKPQWDLEDWWYRFEWQHPGSVHVHGIGKRRNAPIIEWNRMKEDENVMSEVVRYLNSLTTTINPGLNAPIPDKHPCQKDRSELLDDQQDYIDLINKLQRHTRCSPSYCLRVDRGNKQSCRFGYPKENVEQTFVRDDGHGQPELITARNDPFINAHSRLQLQSWRANVDLKPILTIHAALQYIAKYASKVEPKSAAFSEILDQILSSSKPDDQILTPVQKLLLHSVAERDISAQETCHLLLGIPLYHSSRTFVSLNLNQEAPRWVRGTGEEFTTDSGQTEKSPLKRYWKRPTEFEDFTLYRLNLTHKFVRNHWNKCKEKDNIVRIYPRPSPLRDGPQWEEFCRIKVLLHVRHRDFQQLTENGTTAWSTLYNRYLEEINADPIDILGPPIDNEENEIIDEEDYELLEDDEQNEFRLDWMFLAEMGPNAVVDCSSDLGSRNMDRNHDWINDARQRYSNADLVDADTFVSRMSGNCQGNGEEENENVDYQTFNENQRSE